MTKPLSIMSWNIENLLPALPQLHAALGTRRRSRLSTVGQDLSTMVERLGSPDVLCLQEVRVRPKDELVVNHMREALPDYDCHHALCNDSENGRFRGGRAYGVVTYARRELQSLTLPSPEWDREGRVLSVALPGRGLVVGNVYGVNGTDRPHFDHELGRVEGDRHAFKRRFMADLIPHFRFQEAQAGLLVLMGDWNVTRTAFDTHPRLRSELPHALARALFNDTFLPALDVVDVFRELHPDTRAYTWFEPGMREGKLDAARVDLALVSRSLLPRVSAATILEDPSDRFHSDHAPIAIALTDAPEHRDYARD